VYVVLKKVQFALLRKIGEGKLWGIAVVDCEILVLYLVS